jgi:Leucine-rich repeat (LRR) protein
MFDIFDIFDLFGCVLFLFIIIVDCPKSLKQSSLFWLKIIDRNKSNCCSLSRIMTETTPQPDALVKACEESKGNDLILNQCGLESMSEEYAVCAAHVSRLYLSGNRLQTFPGQIVLFAKLTLLDLSFNQLTELPTTVSGLKALRVLLLNNNPLSALPPSVGELTSLRVLNVSDTDLVSLPDQLGACEKLEVLACKNTKLTALPATLAKLPKLRKLSTTVEIGGDLAKVYSKRGFRLKVVDTKKPPPKKK